MPILPAPRARTRRPSGHFALVALAAIASGCALQDLTDVPAWDLRFNIPSQSTSISVGTMLPSGVSIKSDSTAFLVSVNGTSFNRVLSTVCAACVPLNGLSVPKPAFNFTANSTTALPSDVTSATLAGGTIAVAVQNGLTFDPIAIAGAATQGHLLIVVTDAANRQLARDSVNGATTTLAAGATLNRTLTLAPGALTGPLTVTATLNSPAGGNVTMDVSRSVTVTGTPQNIAVSGASVSVTNKTISSSNLSFDLSGLDASISDRMAGAIVQLTITNPFAVTGTMTVRLTAPGVSITKTVALATGTSSPTITLTANEARSIAGKNVSVSITGPVSASAPISVAPRDKVTVNTRIEATINVGGN